MNTLHKGDNKDDDDDDTDGKFRLCQQFDETVEHTGKRTAYKGTW